MDEKEFHQELSQIVARRASATHLVDTMAFVDEVAERLEDDPVFGEFVRLEYSGTGSRGRQLRVHGYTEVDDADGTLGLVIGKWLDSDEPETLTTAEVMRASSLLENFVQEAIAAQLSERITEANPAYELARQIESCSGRINRIRLHVFSNQSLSQKFKEDVLRPIGDIQIERHIWDLQRLKAIYESSREREAVEIDLREFGSSGIPCIEAARTERLRSLLCVIEGPLLADLFERYGSRLLEGNVRSFLGLKGGVNKGIRATIQDSPSLFFAYNNGIAATAAELTVEHLDGRPVVTRMLDFQIVNGGQTTASILSARKKDRLCLDGVTVQMKLTEVNRDDAHDLVPKIAQYANTQNKVAVADFFANHPFHRKMEEISRRLQVPARAGARVQSKWFYERSRGQYQNERLYLTKAKKDAFDLEYPSSQVISKTDLAKYDSAWKAKPHWICLGAQKNFKKFADQFESRLQDVAESEHWTRISPTYGESYYQRMASIAIVWKATESIVSAGRGTWYKGDYRAQLVAYTVALLFNAPRRSGGEFDLMQVWARQAIDSTTEACLRNIATVVQDAVLATPVGKENVGEWSKQEDLWKIVMALEVPCIHRLGRWIISREEHQKIRNEGVRQGIQDDGISLQKTVLDLTTGGYWAALLKWPKLAEMFPDSDRSLVQRASTVQGFTKINLEKDWRRLLQIRQRCGDEGFRKV